MALIAKEYLHRPTPSQLIIHHAYENRPDLPARRIACNMNWVRERVCYRGGAPGSELQWQLQKSSMHVSQSCARLSTYTDLIQAGQKKTSLVLVLFTLHRSRGLLCLQSYY